MRSKPKGFEPLKTSDMKESLVKINANKNKGGKVNEKEDIY